jgi:hypothetical protein
MGVYILAGSLRDSMAVREAIAGQNQTVRQSPGENLKNRDLIEHFS